MAWQAAGRAQPAVALLIQDLAIELGTAAGGGLALLKELERKKIGCVPGGGAA